ncbi:hypothetical protein [Nocardia stercoris]|uniref:Uncharacterized protein n=1 Tax=Nocardia stercoris TaxID=2483361 RepID=A0A3M2KTK7_9NOCA|nr:hypothetical protein [Nocardia stercoris]RMI28274.1 hypothetical protein EBN03_30990 [Nocardia stercoris]
MGPDRRRAGREQRDPPDVVLAALRLGAELLGVDPAGAARRAVELMPPEGDRIPGVTRRVPGADRVRGSDRWHGRHSEPDDESRARRLAVLREVRSDLLEVVRRCQRGGTDRAEFADGIAAGLCAATDKLVAGADMDTFRAWRRGMLLELVEVPAPKGPPRVLATVDAGPGRGLLTVEWDSCERRLALVARLMRAGVPPVVICDRLLADLSVSSPLRYSYR